MQVEVEVVIQHVDSLIYDVILSILLWGILIVQLQYLALGI